MLFNLLLLTLYCQPLFTQRAAQQNTLRFPLLAYFQLSWKTRLYISQGYAEKKKRCWNVSNSDICKTCYYFIPCNTRNLAITRRRSEVNCVLVLLRLLTFFGWYSSVIILKRLFGWSVHGISANSGGILNRRDVLASFEDKLQSLSYSDNARYFFISPCLFRNKLHILARLDSPQIKIVSWVIH